MEPDFTEAIKRIKAAEWLLANNVIVRAAVDHARESKIATFLIGAEFGAMFATKLAEVLPRMEVTDQERIEGYPAPKDDAERLERANARMTAGFSR